MTSRSKNPHRHEPDNQPIHVGSEYSRGHESGEKDLSVAAAVCLDVLQAPDAGAAWGGALAGLLKLKGPGAVCAAFLECSPEGTELRGKSVQSTDANTNKLPSQAQLEAAFQALCIQPADSEDPLAGVMRDGEPRQVSITAVGQLHTILPVRTDASGELLLMPVKRQEELIGVLVLQLGFACGSLVGNELEPIRLVAAGLGMAVAGSRARRGQEQRLQAYRHIQQGALDINQATSLPDVFLALAKAATLCVQAERSVVWSYQEPSQRLDLAAQYVAVPSDAMDVLLPRFKALAERCAGHSAALLYPDLRTEEDVSLEALPEPLPVSIVPLMAFGETVGVVAAVGRQADGASGSVFTAEDEELLKFVGSVGAVAVKNARQGEEIKAGAERLKEMQKMLMATEKLASIGELSAQLAEEIRGPIGSIASFARRLEKSLPLDEVIREDARVLAHEAERIEEILIEQVRLVHEGRDRQDMHQINRIIHDCVALLREEMTGRGVFLEETYADQVPELLLDEARIKHMVINILRSSLDVVRDGDTIRLETLREGDRVLLEIAHTGESVPGEIIESLFVPFATDRPSGAGLGLAVAQQAVKEHGGEISVRSEREWGAIFTISIPIRTNQDRRRQVKRRTGRDRRGGQAA